MIEECARAPQHTARIRADTLANMINSLRYIEPIHDLLLQTKKWALRYFTILDLLFYDISFYITNLFRTLEAPSVFSVFKGDFTSCKPQQPALKLQSYLKVMREFKDMIEAQPFYLARQQEL